jgi:hypothetical protein
LFAALAELSIGQAASEPSAITAAPTNRRATPERGSSGRLKRLFFVAPVADGVFFVIALPSSWWPVVTTARGQLSVRTT